MRTDEFGVFEETFFAEIEFFWDALTAGIVFAATDFDALHA
jgi:hypothetical protein